MKHLLFFILFSFCVYGCQEFKERDEIPWVSKNSSSIVAKLKSTLSFINIFSLFTPEYLRPSFKEKYAELSYRKGKNNDKFIKNMRKYKKVEQEINEDRYALYNLKEKKSRQDARPNQMYMCETERAECEETIKAIKQKQKILKRERDTIAYGAFVYFVKAVSAQRSFNELYAKIPYNKQRVCYLWLKDTVKCAEKLLSKRNWQDTQAYSDKIDEMNRYMEDVWKYRYYDKNLRFPSDFKVGGRKDDRFQSEERFFYYRNQYSNLLKI